MRASLTVSLASIAALLMTVVGCSGSGAASSPSNGGTMTGAGSGDPIDGGESSNAGGSYGDNADGSNSSNADGSGGGHAGTVDGGSNAGTVDGGSSGAAGQGRDAGKSDASGSDDGGVGGSGTGHTIPPGTSWQWQLTGGLDTSLEVKVYDIDLYETDAAQVSALHAKGAQVICYVSVGSYEDWRPDAADFPKAVLGKDYPDWPGERFLDIRALGKLGPIMEKRLNLCAAKGFDGVEPDNMDVFEGGMSRTGFPLTENDGLAYAQWLTMQAHARGLSIGQKNTSQLASKLATVMDWALTEDCFDGDWCASMQPYIDQGKAVLMAEYTDTGVNFGKACSWAKAHNFSAILKGRNLDAAVQFCP